MEKNREIKQEKIDKKVKNLLESGKKKYFTLFDLLVYALLLVLVVASTLFVFFLPKPAGNSFEVYYNNQKIATYSLTQDAEYIFYIDESTNTGKVQLYDGRQYREYNKIVVKNGKVAITETDCNDPVCIMMGAINYGQIICLPHRLKIAVINTNFNIDG